MPNLREKTWTTTTPANVEDAQFWEDHLLSNVQSEKISTAVQSVNNISADEDGNVDIVALPSGGTAGQVLTKISSEDGDAEWRDNSGDLGLYIDEDGYICQSITTT